MTLLLLVISATLWAQKEVQTTDNLLVTGEIKRDIKFIIDDIKTYPSQVIRDVVITNHLGEPRGTAKSLSGVLVKELLKDLELNEDSPKLFSEFYFVFVANDNYKVVYSWNEIFNSPTGDGLYLITSRDGQEIGKMKDSLLILTITDFKTGRRHIKGLSKIIVKRAE